MTPYNRKEGILEGLSVLNTLIFHEYLFKANSSAVQR